MKWKLKKNQKEERLEGNNSSRFLGFILLIYVSFASLAEPSFYFNSQLVVAQENNYELKLAVSRKILLSEKTADPTNYAVDYLLHFNYFLKAFISEEKVDYNAYQLVLDEAISRFEKLSDTMPYKRFALSEAYFYASTLKAKHNELFSAARDIKRAYSLVEENHELFPNFIQNNKTRGVIKVYISTVPESYAWVVKLIGINGDMNEGLRLLRSLSYAKGMQPELKMISQETGYIYAYALYGVAKQTSKAWAETLHFTRDYSTNLLSLFFRSQIALKLNKNETTIKTIQSRSNSPEYLSFFYLDYLLGVAKLNRQDNDAIKPLMLYYSNFKGGNYVKSCLQKMSWYYLLAGDYTKYEEYKKLISTKGVSVNEEDKQAERYVVKPKPDRYLLKARLLYDGGYYNKALKVIENTNVKDLKTLDEKAEFCYRKGRIYEKLGNMPVALKFYEACSIYGVHSPEYYASYASLYIADYYLVNGDKVLAKKFYQRALSFKHNKEYADSIEHRAKLGLKKC